MFQWESPSSGQQWQQQSPILQLTLPKTEQVKQPWTPALESAPTKSLAVATTHRPCIPITIASLKYKGWSSSEHSCLPARNYGCNTPLESWSQYSGGTAQTTAGRHQARPRRCQSNPLFQWESPISGQPPCGPPRSLHGAFNWSLPWSLQVE